MITLQDFNKKEIIAEIAETIAKHRNKILTEEQIALLEKAYDISFREHINQKRKNGEPYFIHIVETAKNCALIGMGTTTIGRIRCRR